MNRPDRHDRRARGKSDPIDTENAAGAVQAGKARTEPKARDELAEAIRVIHTVRAGAVKAKTMTLNAFHGLVVTAPDPLRAALAGRPVRDQLDTAARFRAADLGDPAQAVKVALRRLARRIRDLDEEMAAADAKLAELTGHGWSPHWPWSPR